MPRVPPSYTEFFYDPLTEDVEELLTRFQLTDSVRYEVFSAIWREMCFSDVFRGSNSGGDMKRFCRVALATALKYFLPPYSYQIRVGGLYLMFAFYHTQLVVPPVQIRLALRDWAPVETFLKDTKDSGHLDVIYIYQKLVNTKAFHYTAMPHFLTFNKQRKPQREPVCAEFLGRTTAVPDLLSEETLEEVTNIQSLYEKQKGATKEVSTQATMTHQGFATQLQDCMTKFVTWQQKTFSQDKDKNSDEEEEDKDSGESRAKLLSSIKQKSFRNFQLASKARRHRQAEVVDSSGSGAEQVQEATAPARSRKTPSLRARTWMSLGVTKEESTLQAWLLSAPEHSERVPVKRSQAHRP
ncbi:snRNA-activating protein complex subunit 1-like [Xyrichtys novacula]|uniref:snRNA-activating protein complex subunit 1-like n=1 Tax=Xyrichtys novacula TaxID=13765 RepID=A0AAV1FE04_XYRNO|nr:snRNA-activating protein complex subunit 1-like [Xyrichtys novacula]